MQHLCGCTISCSVFADAVVAEVVGAALRGTGPATAVCLLKMQLHSIDLVYGVTPVLLFVLLVGAEKKIELQDIENDNLKSEDQKDSDDQPEARSETDETGPGALSTEFFKNGYLRFYEGSRENDQPRYVQQYSVSEAPERASVVPKPQYGPPQTAQQAMVGYVSNVPMQIYLVPQYYNEPSAQGSPQHGQQYQSNNVARLSGYQPQEPVQSHNYVEAPSYVAPTQKTYIQQYTQPVAYVYPQPTITPLHTTVAPVLTYQMPVVQYPASILTQQPKGYYQSPDYNQASAVEEVQDNEIDERKLYSSHAEASYVKPDPDFPRHYNSRTQFRDDYRSGPSELPHPNPLLLKPSPSHLAHLPKALPIYRPLTKPVYGPANIVPAPLTPRPIEGYGPKRRPTSLLDSYIPSSVQVEYLKRGFVKDPLVLYETLSNGRHFFPAPVIPRHYERGFLPNQMYHTAAGGITFGHHKRSSKGEKVPRK